MALSASVAAAACITAPAWAGPTGGSVVGGQAVIQTLNQETLIKQSTAKAIINWNTYSIAKGESVLYQQPNASSIALNRILGGQPSVILGSLKANGQVWLVNPNGVLFGKGSTVNAGGLLATTADIANSDFLAGIYNFGTPSANPNAGIANYGTITTNGGATVLAAPSVDNEGTIEARLGTVAVGGGKTFAVDFDGDNLLNFTVTSPAANAQIKNSGAIAADGGKVQITARAAGSIVDNVINTTGIVQANSVSIQNGTVVLDGGTGGVTVGGTVSAAGTTAGATGGTVAVTGGSVNLATGATIDVSGQNGGGTASIGGNFHGAGPLANATTTSIASGATIRADATVNGNGGQVAVWSQQHTDFNGSISAQGGPQGGNGGYVETSSLGTLTVTGNVKAGALKGNSGSWLLDPDDLTIDAAAATAIDTALDNNTSVTLTTTASTSSTAPGTYGTVSPGGAGDITVAAPMSFAPSTGATLTLSAYNSINIDAGITIGGTNGGLVLATNNQQGGTNVAGSLNFLLGQGNVQYTGTGGSLSIGNAGATPDSYTLLYNMTDIGTMNGQSGFYALAAPIDASGSGTFSAPPVATFSGTFNGLGNTISNLTVAGASSAFDVGLFGQSGGTIENVSLRAMSVTGGTLSFDIGGLVGENFGTVSNVTATGTVSAPAGGNIGGLIGSNDVGGSVTGASAGVSVTGGSVVGGLVGDNSGSIGNSFANGAVIGANGVGGLVGANEAGGTITNAYATGSVHDTGDAGQFGGAGGLVGGNAGTLTNVFATGAVSSASAEVGGLVGYAGGTLNSQSAGTVTNGYYDSDATGQPHGTQADGSQGLTGAELIAALPTGFSPSVWGNVNNQTTPYLLNLTGNPQTVFVAGGGTTPYALLFNLGQMEAINNNPGGDYALANSLNATTDPTTPTSWIPLGTDGNGNVWNGSSFASNGTTGFNGTFNGLGNTISNLTIANPSAYVGLFGYVGAGGNVRNIGLVGGSVTGTATNDAPGINVGALVGFNDGALTNVYATTLVTGPYVSNIGGLVGWNEASGTIQNAYASGAVGDGGNGANTLGGLVGWNNGGTVENAYATGSVSLGGGAGCGGNTCPVGGLVGYLNGGTVENAYATGALTGLGFIGGLVGHINNGGTVTNGYYDNTTGQAHGSQGDGSVGLTTAELIAALPTGFDPAVWGNVNNQTTPYLLNLTSNPQTVFVGGAGNTPYSLLFNMAQVQGINSGLSGNYALANSLDATGVTGWIPLGTDGAGQFWNGSYFTSSDATTTSGFSGTFNGLGNTISNLTVNIGSNNYAGLFGYVGSIGTVQNVGVIGGTVSGGTFVGGLIGQNVGQVVNAYSSATVNGASVVGGLVGNNGNGITDSYATGSVSGTSDSIGGLVGGNFGGGITGSYATGAVGGGADNVSYVGGLVGFGNGGVISNSYATSPVTVGATSEYVGGLVGYGQVTIERSFATGAVSTGSSALYVGGLVGYANSETTITDAYATGAVTVGANSGDVGGLIGQNNGSAAISNVYATGLITVGAGTTSVGGLVGDTELGGSVTNGYYDYQTTGQPSGTQPDGSIGESTATLQAALPSGFDSGTWGINAGSSYPYLLWHPVAPSGETVSGVAPDDVLVYLLLNGGGLLTTTSGDGGAFSFTLGANTTGDILAYLPSGSANAVTKLTNSGASGLDLTVANLINLTANGSTIATSDLATAKGSASGAGILYGVSGSTITINPGVALSIGGGANNVAVDDAIVTAGAAGTVSIAGAAISLANNITTGGGFVTFNGPVTLAGAASTLTIDTTNSNGTPSGATVTFAGTLDDTSALAHNLTIAAGSAGDVDFQGRVGANDPDTGNGGVAAGTTPGTVTITSANNVNIAMPLNAPNYDGFHVGSFVVEGTGTTCTDANDCTAGAANLTAANSYISTYNPNGNAGAITIDVSGNVEVGLQVSAGAGVDPTSGAGGSAGAVTIVAGGNVQIGDKITPTCLGGSCATPGALPDIRSFGVVAAGYATDFDGGVAGADGGQTAGNGANIFVQGASINLPAGANSAGGSAIVDAQTGAVGGNGGNITLVATSGNVSAGSAANGNVVGIASVGGSSVANPGNGGAVAISGTRLSISNVYTRGGYTELAAMPSGFGEGGSITLTATANAGAAVTLYGNSDSPNLSPATQATLDALGGEAGATPIGGDIVTLGPGTVAGQGGNITVQGTSEGGKLQGSSYVQLANNSANSAFGGGPTVYIVSGGGSTTTAPAISIRGPIEGTTPGGEALRVRSVDENNVFGSVEVEGTIGAVTPLDYVSLAGNSIALDGNITTQVGSISTTPSFTRNGAVFFNGTVTLNSDITIATAGGDVTFGNNDPTTVDGAHALSVLAGNNGNVMFDNAVGATTPLTSLYVAGKNITVANVTTNGPQTYIDPVSNSITLNGNLTDNTATDIALDGTVTASTPITISTAGTISTGNIVIDGTLSGSATLNAGQGLVWENGTLACSAPNTCGPTQTLSGNVDTGTLDQTKHILLTGNTNFFNGSGSLTITPSIDVNPGASADLAAVQQSGSHGGVKLQGTIGDGNAVHDLTVTALVGQNVFLKGVGSAILGGATDSVSIAANDLYLGGNITTQDASVTIDANTRLLTDVAISTILGGDPSGAAITLNGDVGSPNANAFSLAAGDSTVTAAGSLGGYSYPLGAVSVQGGNIRLGGDIITNNAAVQIASSTATITLTNAVTIDTTDQQYLAGAPVTLIGDIDSDAAGTPRALTIYPGAGRVTLDGTLGASEPLGAVKILTAGVVDMFGGITTAGQSVTFGGAQVDGSDGPTTSGEIVMHSNVTIDTTGNSNPRGADIMLGDSVDAFDVGGQSLTLLGGTAGAIYIDAAIGTPTAIGAFTASGNQIDLGANITTQNGIVTFNSPVILTNGVTVDTTNAGQAAGAAITFNSTVDSDTPGNGALTAFAGFENAGGTVTFNGTVGGTTPIGNLVVNGGEADLNADITTYQNLVEFDTKVVLGKDVTINTSDGQVFNVPAGDIKFESTIDAAAAGVQSLTLEAGGEGSEETGSPGNVTLMGALGGGSPLNTLLIRGGDISLANVTTTGSQYYVSNGNDGALGTVTLNGSKLMAGSLSDGSGLSAPAANTPGSDIEFVGNVDVASNALAIQTNGTISGGLIGVSGTLSGNLANLTLDAGQGLIAIGGTVLLNQETTPEGYVAPVACATATCLEGPTQTVSGNSDNDISNDSGISNGAHIVLTGDTTLTIYNAPLVQTVDSLTASSAYNLTVNDPGAENTIAIYGTLGDAAPLHSVTVTPNNGEPVSIGSIGSPVHAGSLGTVSVTGSTITAGGTISTRDGMVEFNGPVVLASDLAIDTSVGNSGNGAGITFTSTIDATVAGGQSLSLNAGASGAVRLDDNVGDTTPLGNVSISGGCTSCDEDSYVTGLYLSGDITTKNGKISIDAPTMLENDVTIGTVGNGTYQGTGADIKFSANAFVQSDPEIDEGPEPALTVNAGTGAITVGAPLGQYNALGGVTLTGSRVNLGADIYTADGNITIQGPGAGTTQLVLVGGGSNIDCQSCADGIVTINGTIDATTPGGQQLNIEAGGGIVIGGDIGDKVPLGNIYMESATQIALNGANIVTSGYDYGEVYGGTVEFNGPVVLGNNVTIDTTAAGTAPGGFVQFDSTVDDSVANQHTLTVNTGSDWIWFQQAIGDNQPIQGLTVTSSNSQYGIEFDGNVTTGAGGVTVTAPAIFLGETIDPVITTASGQVNFNGSTYVDEDTTIDTTNGGQAAGASVTFNGTLDDGNAPLTDNLTILAGTGDVNFNGRVGQNLHGDGTDLASIQIESANDVNLNMAFGRHGDGFSVGSLTIEGSDHQPGAVDVLGPDAYISTVNHEGGDAGDVKIVTSGNVEIGRGILAFGTMDEEGTGGAGGNVTIKAGGTVAIEDCCTLADLPHSTSTAGGYTVANIDAQGIAAFGANATDSDETPGAGGKVFIKAGGDIVLPFGANTSGGNAIYGDATGNGADAGNITLISTGGNVYAGVFPATGYVASGAVNGNVSGLDAVGGSSVDTNNEGAGGNGGNGGNVLIVGNQIFSGRIYAAGGSTEATDATGGDGGNITLAATTSSGPAVTLYGQADGLAIGAPVTFLALGGVTGAAFTVVGGVPMTTSGTATGNGGSITIGGPYGAVLPDGAYIQLVDNSANSAYGGGPNVVMAAGGLATPGNISLNGPVEGTSPGAENLAIAAAGSVTVAGDIGDNTPLGAVDLSGFPVNLQGNITTAGGTVSFSDFDPADLPNGWGGVVLQNNVTIDTTAGGSSSGASITFAGTLDDATAFTHSLTIQAGTGDVTFDQRVGYNNPVLTGCAPNNCGSTPENAAPPGAVIIESAHDININTPLDPEVSPGVFELDNNGFDVGKFVVEGNGNAGCLPNSTCVAGASGSLNAGNSYISTIGGANGNGGAVTIDVGGSIEVGWQIDASGYGDAASGGAVSLIAGGSVTVGDQIVPFCDAGPCSTPGTLADLLSFGVITSGFVTGTDGVSGVNQTAGNGGNLFIQGSSISLPAGAITAGGGAITDAAPGAKGGNAGTVTLVATDGTNGTVTIGTPANGNVVGIVAVGGAAIDGAGGDGAAVLVSGTRISLSNILTFGGDTGLSSGAGDGGAITLTATATTGAAVTLYGESDAPYGTADQATLDSAGGKTGATTIVSLVQLGGGALAGEGANITIQSGSNIDGPIALAGTSVVKLVDNTANSANAGGSTIFIFSGGGDTPSILIDGPIEGTSAGKEALRISNLTVGGPLGSVEVNGTIGATVPLGYVSLDGSPVILDGNITTEPGLLTGAGSAYSGNVFLNGPVTLAADVTIDTTAGGVATGGANITFGNVYTGAVDGAHALTLTAGTSGIITIYDAIGQNTALSSVSMTAGGGIDLNGGAVNTTGTQEYNGVVTLSTDDDLTGSTTTFDSSISGNQALNVTGNGVFEGSVDIGSLSVSGTSDLNGGSVSTAGTQNYTGAVTLSTTNTLASTGTGATGNITFGSTVDAQTSGGQGLTVNTAGTTAFEGVVGTTALASLTVDQTGTLGGTTDINTTSVTTSGTQTYNNAVVLTSSATLTSTGTGAAGNITFGKTVDAQTTGTQSLTVNTAGTTAFNGVVGTTPLASLTVDQTGTLGGTTAINTAGITTAGTQNYNNAVVLGASTTLTSTGTSAAGNITLAKTVDAQTAGSQSLTVNTAGQTKFGGAVGTTALASVTTDAPGTTDINGGSVTTTGKQTYNDAVILSGTLTTLTSTGTGAAGNITLASTVDGTASGVQSLTVNTAGTTTFGGAVGGTPLLTVITDAPGTTAINGGSVTTAGTQTYNDAVVLGANTTLTSTGTAAAGNITFGSTVDDQTAGTHSLTVNTAGTTTFDGAVGTTALASVTTDAPGTTDLNGGPATTTGTQTYNDAVVLTANTTLTSTGTGAAGNITFASTVDDQTAGTHSLTVNTAGTTIFDGAVGTTALASVTTDAPGTTDINGGTVTTTGTQAYNDAVVLGANTTLTSTGTGAAGNITFGSTVDDQTAGTHSLTVNTAGTTTFDGAVGTTALASVTTDAPGTTDLNGGPVTTTGTQTYNDAVVLSANTTLTSTGIGAAGNITFASTVDDQTAGTHSLTVNTAGTTIFDGAVGTTALASITTDAPGTTDLNGGPVTTTGTQTYNDAVVLSADTTLTSTGTAAAGNITFASTVDDQTAGTHSLTVNTAGTTTFDGAVGTTALASLTTDAPGTTDLNGGTVNTTGTQTYNDAVVLSANTTLTSTGTAAAGNITFGSMVDDQTAGTHSLTVNTAGTTTFDGAVGTTALASVTTDAPGTTDLNGGPVTTTGTQTYNDAVVLTANTTLTSTGTGAAGNITFASTVDDQTAGTHSLTVNTAGTTIFDGAVGTTALASLTTDAPGTTDLNGGTVNTTGTQTYNDAVVLSANTTLTSTGAGAAGNITFVKTVDGGFGLTVNTAGTTTFDGAVGTTPLTSVTTDAPGTTDINGPSITTSGTQTYNDAVVLTANTTLTSTGAGAAGNITFASTVDDQTAGTHSLTVNTAGTTTFGGAVGTTALASLTTDAPGTTDINGGTVTTTGTQAYNDAVVLGANTTLTSTGTGAAGNITFAKTLDGGFSLLVNTAGTTTFDGAVGTTPLTSLTTDAPGITDINGPSITTSGTQTYNDAVVLTATTTLTSTGAGAAGNVTFAKTIDGGFGLTVNTAGTTTFVGTVGGTPLANLTTDAAGNTVIDAGSITTSGAQTYNDAVIFGGAATTLTSTGSGAIAFAKTVDAQTAGVQSLTVNTNGATTFGGAVGTTALASLTTDAGGTTKINGGSVTTTGTQTYNDGVALGANTTLMSTGAGAAGNITFASTVDGGFSLVVNTAGITAFEGNVGTAPLTSLTTDAPGTTDINANITTSGAQTYNDPVVLTTNATLTSTGSGAITFAKTVDAQTAGGESLTVNTAGVTTFDGVVGGTPLSSLTTDAPGTTVLNTTSVTTTGTQTYDDAVTLNATEALNGTMMTFGSILNSTLALTVSGNGVFDGVVSLASLNVTGTSDINGGSVTTTGAQTYTGAVTLSADDTLTGTTMTFDSTIGGGHALTVTGNGVFDGAVNIAGLSVSGTSNLNAGTVTTSGTQTYTGAVTLAAGETLTGTTVTFGSTVSGAQALAVTGDAVFDGTVNTASLSVSGTSDLNTGSVTTTGTQTYTGGATLTTATVLSGTTVTLGPVSGGDALTVTGNAAFDGAVNIASLSVSGTTDLSVGTVTTSGTQTYSGAVTLGTDDTLSGTSVTFASSVNGGHALTVTGNGVFDGAVTIGSLDVTGTTDLNVGAVTTTGTQTYGGALTLSTATVLTGSTVTLGPANDAQALTITGNGVFDGAVTLASLNVSGTSNFDGGSITTSGAQLYSGAATLGGASTLSSNGGGNITFGSTVDGGSDLTVGTSGTVQFNGAVGGATPLHSLTDTAAATTLDGPVTTVAGQSYGAVTFAATETLTAQTGSIALGAVTGGANGITLIADSIALNGNWSGTGPRTLYPYTGGSAVTLAPNVTPATFNLDVTELGFLDGGSPSLVTIGSGAAPHATGAITTGDFTFDAPLSLIGTSITLDPVGKDANTGNLTLNSGTGPSNGAVNLATGDFLYITAGSSAITGTVNGQSGNNAAQYVFLTKDGPGPFTTNNLADGSLPGGGSTGPTGPTVPPGQTNTTPGNQTNNSNNFITPPPTLIQTNPFQNPTGSGSTESGTGGEPDPGASLFSTISPNTPTDLNVSSESGGSDAIIIAYANPPPIKPAVNAEAARPQTVHAIGAYLDQMLTPTVPRKGVPGISFGYSLSGNSALW